MPRRLGLRHGTKGTADIMKHHDQRREALAVTAARNRTCTRRSTDDLFAAIRSGTPINNGAYMSKSTLMAIMGRMATYTGVMTWEQS